MEMLQDKKLNWTMKYNKNRGKIETHKFLTWKIEKVKNKFIFC